MHTDAKIEHLQIENYKRLQEHLQIGDYKRIQAQKHGAGIVGCFVFIKPKGLGLRNQQSRNQYNLYRIIFFEKSNFEYRFWLASQSIQAFSNLHFWRKIYILSFCFSCFSDASEICINFWFPEYFVEQGAIYVCVFQNDLVLF